MSTTDPAPLPEHPLSRFLRRRPRLAAVPPPLDLDALATDLHQLAQRTDRLRYDCVVHDRYITLDEASSRAGRIAVELRDLAMTLDRHNRRTRKEQP